MYVIINIHCTIKKIIAYQKGVLNKKSKFKNALSGLVL